MPSGKFGPQMAWGLGVKNPGMPDMIVDRLASELPNIDDGQSWGQSWSGPSFRPTPSQNSRRRAMRLAGFLPAINAPLFAPIEVPVTQSGPNPPPHYAPDTPDSYSPGAPPPRSP